MQGIYTHIPETNYVPKEYGVAVIIIIIIIILLLLGAHHILHVIKISVKILQKWH